MFLVPFLVFFGLIFMSRYLDEKTMKPLSLEEKGKLVGLFSNQRLIHLGLTIAVMAGVWFLSDAEIISARLALILYVVYALGALAVNVYLTYRKLTENGFARETVRGFMTSSVIRVVAVLLMLGSMMVL